MEKKSVVIQVVVKNSATERNISKDTCHGHDETVEYLTSYCICLAHVLFLFIVHAFVLLMAPTSRVRKHE